MNHWYIIVVFAMLASTSGALAGEFVSPQDSVLVANVVAPRLPPGSSVREVVCVPVEHRVGGDPEYLVGAWGEDGLASARQYFVSSEKGLWTARELNWWLAFDRNSLSSAVRLIDPVGVISANKMLDAVEPFLEAKEWPTAIVNLPEIQSEKDGGGKYQISREPGAERLAVRTRMGIEIRGRIFFFETKDSLYVARPSGSWTY
jgi:hypothetical protein